MKMAEGSKDVLRKDAEGKKDEEKREKKKGDHEKDIQANR